MMVEMIPGRVSLVVASYNHAGFLARRMDSLLAQTYPDIEILVIDDCSPDNSLEVLQQYANDERVTLISREQNGGWVEVSNQGIAMASGEFVLFANCDDSCEPDMVAHLVSALQSHPLAGVAFCRSRMVDENDRTIGDDYQVRDASFRQRCVGDTYIDGAEMRRFLMHSCVIPNLSAALMRRSCFEVTGMLTGKYLACSDWDLFFRFADHFGFCYVSKPLNHFRQHGTTIRSATKGRVTYDEFFRLLLGEVLHGDFTLGERLHFRLHVMYLWALYLLRPSLSGWKNFAHHTGLVLRLDPFALPLLPIAMLQRISQLPSKILRRLKF